MSRHMYALKYTNLENKWHCKVTYLLVYIIYEYYI